MSNLSYQSKLDFIKSRIDELESSSEKEPNQLKKNNNGIKRKADTSILNETNENKKILYVDGTKHSNSFFELKNNKNEISLLTNTHQEDQKEKSNSSFNYSFEKFCEYSNSFQMNLDELYTQMINLKKQKATINGSEINQQANQQNDEIQELFNLNNFVIYSEINVFSKKFLKRFPLINNEKLIDKSLNQECQLIMEKLREKLVQYRFEKAMIKTDFFQSSNLEKENERVLDFINSMHSLFRQCLNDKKKFFYYLTNNLVVVFLHVESQTENDSQVIALLSGKNKNLCRLLEKEKIHYQILHKHEKMEGISTPQKLMSLESNRNVIYGLEVGPGLEILKISKKHVHAFFNYLLNDNIQNNYPCELISSFYFNNSTIVFPKIVYEGKITISENEKSVFFEDLKNQKPNVNNEKTYEFFHKESSPLDIFELDQLKLDSFYKIFKITIKGNFFTSHLKDLHEIINEISIPHKIEGIALDLTKFFRKEIYNSKSPFF